MEPEALNIGLKRGYSPTLDQRGNAYCKFRIHSSEHSLGSCFACGSPTMWKLYFDWAFGAEGLTASPRNSFSWKGYMINPSLEFMRNSLRFIRKQAQHIKKLPREAGTWCRVDRSLPGLQGLQHEAEQKLVISCVVRDKAMIESTRL